MNPSLQTLLALIRGNSAITEADQEAMVKAANELARNLTVAEFKLNRTTKEKRTVSILLEETIDELQRKSLVVERANGELTKALSKVKATQAQLIQSEKMASLGELMAGIAHEIQNPLNFVSNFSEISVELVEELQQLCDRGDIIEARAIAHDIQQNLLKITHHGIRASRIVKGMLEHSRTSSDEKQPTNLNALADEYLRLVYQGVRAKDKALNIQIETEFASDLPTIEVVPQEIGRVLLNLYNNAFYAVQQKQKTALTDYRPTVSVHTAQANGQVEIRVSDNGVGIPEAIKAKIFQPFFTTKPTGEGTGLGLSLSYDIVTKGHQGSFTVESQEGKGAEFVIQLPTAVIGLVA